MPKQKSSREIAAVEKILKIFVSLSLLKVLLPAWRGHHLQPVLYSIKYISDKAAAVNMLQKL